MTKLREPLTIEHILAQAISKLDEDEIKNITSKSISHFRKCSDPDDKDHNLHFTTTLVPYKTDTTWVDDQIIEMKKH